MFEKRNEVLSVDKLNTLSQAKIKTNIKLFFFNKYVFFHSLGVLKFALIYKQYEEYIFFRTLIDITIV